MNYGRKGVRRKQKELNSKSVKISKMILLTILKAFLICILSAGIIGLCLGFGVFKGILDSAPEMANVNVSPSGFSTFVYDSQGQVIEKLVAESSNRIPVSIDQIPANLAHAFVALEDERFYEHNGIDIQGIIRAFVVGVKNKDFSEGASTITQQLLKNNVFITWTEEDSFMERLTRKIQEQYLAIELEKVMSKDLILENYMNTINLGQNTLGVQAASNRYFDKPVYELTLSECAVIAAITQNPTRFNPISHPEENALRRTKVLNNMLKHGYITQQEYDIAMTDDVYSRIKNVNESSEVGSPYTYFVDELTNQVKKDLMEQLGYTETQAIYAIYSGGLSIYSTQDPAIQAVCDEVYSNEENYPVNVKWFITDCKIDIIKADGTKKYHSTENFRSAMRELNAKEDFLYSSKDDAQAVIDAYQDSLLSDGDEIYSRIITITPQPQVSLTIIDQNTGAVVAMIGGRGTKEGSKTLNRATQSLRQPGSTFKILSAYAPALDSAGLTLATVFNDAPFNYANGKPVSNWYDTGYKGLCSIRYGIEQSLNIVAAKTITMITPQLAYDYLLNFGFTTLVERRVIGNQVYSDITQSTALGGLTDGVTNVELSAAFACIANNGVYIKPHLYTKVVNHDGVVLLDNTNPEARQVIKETTAYLLTNAMVDVVTKGTGGAANFPGMAIAGKTGTTSKNNDSWFAGFTPYYTAVTWTGYDLSTQMSKAELALSKSLWKAVMSRIHADLPNKSFTMPSGIVTATVCSRSGKLPIEGLCDVAGTLKTEYFADGTVPADTCDVHYQGMVCAYSNLPACEDCPFATPGTLELTPIEDSVLAAGSALVAPDGTPPTNRCPHNDEFFANPDYEAIIQQQFNELAVRAGLPADEPVVP